MSDCAPILAGTTGSRSPQQPVDSLTEAARGGREDPPGRINRSSVLIGVGAVCAVLGMVSLVIQQIWSIVAGEVIEIDTPILGRILYAAQITLFVVAVVGLYLQRKAFNTFGQIATLVALWGTLLWSVGSITCWASDPCSPLSANGPEWSQIPCPLTSSLIRRSPTTRRMTTTNVRSHRRSPSSEDDSLSVAATM